MNEQLTFAGDTVPTCNRCGVPTNYAYERYDGEQCRTCRAEDEAMVTCTGCDAEFLEGDLYIESQYNDPWEAEPTDTGFKWCQTCIDRGADSDGKFYCDGCSRDIAEDNGRMLYYRILNDCEQVCLRCIEADLKSGGIEALDDDDLLADVFAGRKLFGMFFNVGELEAEGWVAVEGFDDVLANPKAIGAECAALYASEQPFIIGYESLSTFGDEGYVTLYTRPTYGYATLFA